MIYEITEYSPHDAKCILQGHEAFFKCDISFSDKDKYGDYFYRYRLISTPIQLENMNSFSTVDSMRMTEQWSKWKELNLEASADFYLTVSIPHYPYDVLCTLELEIRDRDYLISQALQSAKVLALYNRGYIDASIDATPVGLNNVSRIKAIITSLGIIRPYNWEEVTNDIQEAYVKAVNYTDGKNTPLMVDFSIIGRSSSGTSDNQSYSLPMDWTQNLDKDTRNWELASKDNGLWKLTSFENFADVSTMRWKPSDPSYTLAPGADQGQHNRYSPTSYIESRNNRSNFTSVPQSWKGWYVNYGIRHQQIAFSQGDNQSYLCACANNSKNTIGGVNWNNPAIVFTAPQSGRYTFTENVAPHTNTLEIETECQVYHNGKAILNAGLIITKDSAETAIKGEIDLAQGDMLVFGYTSRGVSVQDSSVIKISQVNVTALAVWDNTETINFPYNSFAPIHQEQEASILPIEISAVLPRQITLSVKNFRGQLLGLSSTVNLNLYRRNPPLQAYNRSVQIGTPLNDTNKDYNVSKLLVDNRTPDKQLHNLELRSEENPSILFTHDPYTQDSSSSALTFIANPIKQGTGMLLSNCPIAIGSDSNNCVIFSYDAGLRITVVNNGKSTDIPLVFGDSK